jgi:ribonuclease P protein component
MSKFLILKKRKDFLKAAKDITMVTKNVMLQAACRLSDENVNNARIGFTATKKLGKANVRNRVKRRLRAIIQELYTDVTLDNVDYVLVGRFNTYSCSYQDLKKDIIWAFKKTNKMIQDRNNEKDIDSDC